MLLSRTLVVRAGSALNLVRKFAVASQVTIPTNVHDDNPVLKNVDARSGPEGILKLTWNGNQCTSFSSVFLRDSCRCTACYDSAAKQRMLDTVKDIPLDISPKTVDITRNGIVVTWPDGHQSTYTHEFLWSQQDVPQSEAIDDEDRDIRYIEPVVWKRRDVEGDIPTYDFEALLKNDSVQYNWFKTLSQYGFTILEGAAHDLNNLNRLKPLFGGYTKSTQYGDLFQVVTKPDPSSLAYKPGGILPHVDLPHWQYYPGIQVLHCIEQFSGSGGQTTLTDGLNVAQQLKETDESSYELLTQHKVTYRDIGTDYYGDFETFYERPIIGLEDGRVRHFSYSNWLRDYEMKGSAEEIHNFYKAYYKLTHLITHPDNVLTFKLKEGEIVVFDNRRLLHGRSALDAKEGKLRRFLNGCYFDWDGLFSYMRRVKRRLDEKEKSDSKVKDELL